MWLDVSSQKFISSTSVLGWGGNSSLQAGSIASSVMPMWLELGVWPAVYTQIHGPFLCTRANSAITEDKVKLEGPIWYPWQGWCFVGFGTRPTGAILAPALSKGVASINSMIPTEALSLL